MPEILTESFCERCGTRYTFESAAPPKTKKLGKFKTLSKGLKNYVLSDDTSMDEAMAAARSDEERELTSQQLDAFHSTFNFCMTCRQYTCGNCWNQVEGRCLTCAPHLGHEVLPAPFPELNPLPSAETVQFEASAWPVSDLQPEATDAAADAEAEAAASEFLDRLARITEAPAAPSSNGQVAEPAVPPVPDVPAWPEAADEATPVAAIEAAEAPDSEPAVAAAIDAATVEAATSEAAADEPPAVVAEPPAAADAAAPSVDERAAAAAKRTSDLLAKFRPGQNIDAELEAYEAALAADEDAAASAPVIGETEPEAVVAAAPEPEPVAAEAEPEPTVAEPTRVAAEAEPGPVAAEAEPEPMAAETDLEPVGAAFEAEPAAPGPEPEPVRADVVEQPTWRIVAPEPQPLTNGHSPAIDPAAPPIAATAAPPPAPAEPQWPAAPEWPVAPPNASMIANHRTSASAATEALWAASARDVVARPGGAPAGGVQPCSNCGLSLSATARFCRRCGSRQGE